MANNSLGKAGYYLALIGGILMIILSVVAFLGMGVMMPFGMPFALGGMMLSVVGLVLGVIAIVGSKHATEPVWAIVLVIIGLVGIGTGGFLVVLGGLLGLVSKYA